MRLLDHVLDEVADVLRHGLDGVEDVLEHVAHQVRDRHPQAAGRVLTEIAFSTPASLVGKDVLLVDDIVDTGITLGYLLAHIHEHAPASLRVCALVDKPESRKIDLHPDWTAFPVHEPMADRFLVGYGLDWMERFRGLPYIGSIPRPRHAEGFPAVS